MGVRGVGGMSWTWMGWVYTALKIIRFRGHFGNISIKSEHACALWTVIVLLGSYPKHLVSVPNDA